MSKKPKLIDISQEELDALIERVEAGKLLDSDREIIRAMAETISILSQAVDEKTASIRRLLKMIFGSSTEKTDAVVNKEKESAAGEKDESGRQDKDRPKGHGKNGAASYSGANKVEITHDTLKPKDKCPKCLKGKLYKVKTPKTIVRITGQSPLHATVFEMQKLRKGSMATTSITPAHSRRKQERPARSKRRRTPRSAATSTEPAAVNKRQPAA